MLYEHLTTQKVVASALVRWPDVEQREKAPRGEAGRIRDFLQRLATLDAKLRFSIAKRTFSVASRVDVRDDGGCSGQIVFSAVEATNDTVRLGFKLSRDARDRRGRLTLTFNPSEMLAGVDVAPTLATRKSPALPFPSSSSVVTSKLLRFGFDLLDTLHKLTNRGAPLFSDARGGELYDEDIRLESVEWEMLVATQNSRRFLEYLTLIFVPPSRQCGKLVRLGELLKLKPDFKNDSKTGEIASVTFKRL